MRPLSINAIKHNDSRQGIPREGTKIRAVYNKLQTGEPVHAKWVDIQYLETFYEVECNRVDKGVYQLK